MSSGTSGFKLRHGQVCRPNHLCGRFILLIAGRAVLVFTSVVGAKIEARRYPVDDVYIIKVELMLPEPDLESLVQCCRVAP